MCVCVGGGGGVILLYKCARVYYLIEVTEFQCGQLDYKLKMWYAFCCVSAFETALSFPMLVSVFKVYIISFQ